MKPFEMFRCRLFRSTHPKKLLMVLLAVALCAIFMSWRATSECWERQHNAPFLLHTRSIHNVCTDVHSDVTFSVKCLGGDGCSRQGKMALLEVATEAFEMTEGTPVRLQGVYACVCVVSGWLMIACVATCYIGMSCTGE